MDYKDQLIRMTEQAGDSLFKTVRATPEDKRSWAVLDEGRTVMDILQEVAQCPIYSLPILKARACPPFNPEDFGEFVSQRKAWDTVDKCEAAWKDNCSALFTAIRDFPDDELSKEIDLPFVEGLRQSMADIMAYPYWNTAYHLGQVCYIQTLYGDKEMR